MPRILTDISWATPYWLKRFITFMILGFIILYLNVFKFLCLNRPTLISTIWGQTVWVWSVQVSLSVWWLNASRRQKGWPDYHHRFWVRKIISFLFLWLTHYHICLTFAAQNYFNIDHGYLPTKLHRRKCWQLRKRSLSALPYFTG